METNLNNIFTIEINLDDDFANACSYHVDDLMSTIKQNIHHVESGQKINSWVLIGLANSLSEALDKCEKLRILLCNRNNRKPYGIEELINEFNRTKNE